MFDIGKRRIGRAIEIGKLFRAFFRLGLRRLDLEHYGRGLFLVGDRLGDRLPHGYPHVRERLGAFGKRIRHRHRPLRRVGAVGSGLGHQQTRVLRRVQQHRPGIFALRGLEHAFNALSLAILQKPVARPGEIAPKPPVGGIGAQGDLRGGSRLFTVAAFVLEFRDQFGGACAVGSGKHQRTQQFQGVGDIAAAVTVNSGVPDLRVRQGRRSVRGREKRRTGRRQNEPGGKQYSADRPRQRQDSISSLIALAAATGSAAARIGRPTTRWVAPSRTASAGVATRF